MSLATPECKHNGFLASSGFLVKLSSNSELMLKKIKPTQANTVQANTELTLIQGLAYPAQNSPPHQTAFHKNAGATMTEVHGAPRKVGLKKKLTSYKSQQNYSSEVTSCNFQSSDVW